MSARKLLEILDRNGLLEDAVIANLRKQVAEGKGKVTAETIAKALVDKGHLTRFQATKLVGEATEADEVEEAPKSASVDDDLGLAPFDDEEAEETPPPAPAKPATSKSTPPKAPTPAKQGGKPGKPGKPKVEEIVMLEDADALTPVEEAGAALTPVGLTELPNTPAGLEPLGGLTPLDSSDPFTESSGNGLQPAAAPLVKPKKKETRWDTKLMLGGFGFLAFLIFMGGLLYYSIFSEPTIKLWEAAEQAYNGGNYTDAKDKYEKYLGAVGEKGENASKARVRIHLTKLRNDVGDPVRGLATAEDLLPKIDVEADSSVARDEYPGILPLIAEGFIKRAQNANDTKTAEDLVVQAKKARDILYSPGILTGANRQKIQPQLASIDENIGLLERSISQDKELAQTTLDIAASVDAGDTIKGYQLYNDLLKKYPGLKNDSSLNEAVAKITARERTLVKIKQEVLTAQTTDEARKSEFRVVLATRMPGDAKIQNQVATLAYGHSAYGLDAGTGKVLWSRYLGPTSRTNPVRHSAQADSDVYLVDSQHQELLRIKAADGALVWRLKIGEPFAEPAVAGNKVYVSTESGRILDIDAETGESKRHAIIQQRLTVSPVVSPDRPRMYQVGDHSNVYVIHSESMQCEDVIYLGHRTGTVEIPPLILMGHVFIAENPAIDYSLVHALRVRSQGEGPKLFRPQDPIRTAGRVVVPLVPYGRRLLILTDRGETRVFDVDSTKNENTLNDSGRLPPRPSNQNAQIGYPLTDNTTLWVADDKLTKYTFQATVKEIVRDPAMTNVGDTFVAPIQPFGNHLIHARRVAGSTGVTVACIHVDDPRKTVWQTQLAVPAGRISVDPAKKEIVAISSAASLFQINGQVLKSGYVDQPLQSVAAEGMPLSFTEAIDFENGKLAFFNPADHKRLLIYDPSIAESRLKIVSLDLQNTEATCTPIAYLGALAVPTNIGEIRLFKVADGSVQALPFQPKLEPGEKVNMRQPALVANGQELVVVDDRRNIYRVGIKDQPQPHLAELASNKLDVDIVSGLAAVGDTIYGVSRTADQDALVAISAKELKVTQQFDLKGSRVTWGPHQVGAAIMVVTDAKELRLLDAEQKERWEKPAVMHGNPAGPPLVVGETYYFASVQGAVWGINTAGQESGSVELGEPLGASPTAYQERLLLCGNDGTLHVIPVPAGNPPASGAATQP